MIIVIARRRLRILRDSRNQLSRGASALSILLATAAMLTAAWWFGLREPFPAVAADHDYMVKLHEHDVIIPPSGRPSLEIGDLLPDWPVQGWLNGPGPAAHELAGKMIVVDIWNEL